MAADVVGYSAQMGIAEQSTIDGLEIVSDILQRHIDEKGGRRAIV
jgi:hypothetical protein